MQKSIRKSKLIFTIVYALNFAGIATLFFTAFIPGYKEKYIVSPRILTLWTLLAIRFVLDCWIIGVFLRYLYFFVLLKLERLVQSGKPGLTNFHKFILVYIFIAVFLEFIGAVLRSFFGPLILVDNDDFVLPKFTEHYRLIVYSISDFLVGVALLYLFYTQGILLKQRHVAQQRSLVSMRKYKDLESQTKVPKSET